MQPAGLGANYNTGRGKAVTPTYSKHWVIVRYLNCQGKTLGITGTEYEMNRVFSPCYTLSSVCNLPTKKSCT